MARMLTRLEHSPSEPDPAKLLPGCLRREVQIARVGYLDARGRDFQNGQLVMENPEYGGGHPDPERLPARGQRVAGWARGCGP
jgi:hypothetical protein